MSDDQTQHNAALIFDAFENHDEWAAVKGGFTEEQPSWVYDFAATVSVALGDDEIDWLSIQGDSGTADRLRGNVVVLSPNAVVLAEVEGPLSSFPPQQAAASWSAEVLPISAVSSMKFTAQPGTVIPGPTWPRLREVTFVFSDGREVRLPRNQRLDSSDDNRLYEAAMAIRAKLVV